MAQYLARIERFERDLKRSARSGHYDREVSLELLSRDLAEALREHSHRNRLPLPVGGATRFGGVETLITNQTQPAAVGPIATPGLSVLPRECLEFISGSYFANHGQSFRVTAHGLISTTATVPTYQLQLQMGVAYANPLAGLMVAQNAVITPAAQANADWFLDVLGHVVLPGSGGTVMAVGKLTNNWAAAATFVITPFKNATPPTAVSISGTGGLAASQLVDIVVIMGAATAGNTAQCQGYALESLN